MHYHTSKFGMAKSFMTMGQSAGFDMTDQEDMNRFMQLYNANFLSGEAAYHCRQEKEYQILDLIYLNLHNLKNQIQKRKNYVK